MMVFGNAVINMKYIIVQSETVQKLVNEVNGRIKDGWIPSGGIAIYPHVSYYLQAMKKSWDKKFGKIV